MRHAVLAILFSSYLGASALADIVLLKDGGRVEGPIVKETATQVFVKTKYGTMPVDRTKIKKITKGRSYEKIYVSRRKKLKKTDTKALMQLAEWCEKKKLTRQAQSVYRAVTKVASAECLEAQRRLGMSYFDDQRFTLAARTLRDLVERTEGKMGRQELGRVNKTLAIKRGEYVREAKKAYDRGEYKTSESFLLDAYWLLSKEDGDERKVLIRRLSDIRGEDGRARRAVSGAHGGRIEHLRRQPSAMDAQVRRERSRARSGCLSRKTRGRRCTRLCSPRRL